MFMFGISQNLRGVAAKRLGAPTLAAIKADVLEPGFVGWANELDFVRM